MRGARWIAISKGRLLSCSQRRKKMLRSVPCLDSRASLRFRRGGKGWNSNSCEEGAAWNASCLSERSAWMAFGAQKGLSPVVSKISAAVLRALPYRKPQRNIRLLCTWYVTLAVRQGKMIYVYTIIKMATENEERYAPRRLGLHSRFSEIAVRNDVWKILLRWFHPRIRILTEE